jgi:hypothetical protein
MFDKILENFQKGSFQFSFSTELLETEDFKLASQESPYFHFKTPETIQDGALENGDSETKEETRFSPKSKSFDPFASNVDGPKRQESRFAYVNDPLSQVLAQPISANITQTQLVRAFSPPRMADPILAQQIQSTQTASQFKTATPPPPGMYFSHAQQYDIQRRQQLLESQQRFQNLPANPDYGYYPQVQPSTMRNYTPSYEDQDHASVYAPQARRHLIDNQGSSHLVSFINIDSLQDLNGSLMNMRMSPHLQQGFGGQQPPPPPQSYAGGQGAFVGRRYMGNAF